MPSVNEELFDRGVRHEIGIQRLSASVVRRMLAILNRVESDVVRQIQNRMGNDITAFTERRLNLLLESIREATTSTYNSMNSALVEELVAVAEYELTFQEAMLRGSLPDQVAVQFEVVRPTLSQVKAAALSRPFQGRVLKEWGKDLEEGAFKRIRDAIRIGWVEGETVDQLVTRVRGTKALQYRDGVLEINRRGATGLVRTAINHTANYSRQDFYAQNDDLLKGWRFVATLDSRTTLTCASLDGKVYPLGNGPMPPRHWNCRSSSVPVTKSWKELGLDLEELPEGTRASMNGQVPASETYDSWLRRQPKDFQDDVLGKTKARLFRDGGLSLDRFTNRVGDELTLDQLRKKEAEAFRRAGI